MDVLASASAPETTEIHEEDNSEVITPEVTFEVDEEAEFTVSENSGGMAEVEGQKSRRKKKKKKKKQSKEGEATGHEKAHDMLAVEEADAKYSSVMESLRSGDELCLWVQLQRCRIGDKKTRKLAEALHSSKSVTSVDLSFNLISDDGAQQLARALASGAAPDLIQLDLQGNPLTERGSAALQEASKARRLLKIDVLEAHGEEGAWAHPVFEALPRGPWLTEASRQREEELSSLSSPRDIVDLCLRAAREARRGWTPSAGVWQSYRRLSALIVRELREELHKTLSAQALAALPAGIRLTCQHLKELLSVRHLSTEPHPCQSGQVAPSAGLRRVAAVELTQRLLLSCSRVVEGEVLAADAVNADTVDLIFAFPHNSRLHSAFARLAQVVLARPGTAVASALLDGPRGLIARLAEEGSASWQVPIGQRKGYVGHVILLSQKLLSLASQHRALKKKLDSSEPWRRFSAEGGPLRALIGQQEGPLGGHRPTTGGRLRGGSEEEEPSEAEELQSLHQLFLERSQGGFKASK